MKVTKLIREYVEDSVAKKFDPAFEALDAKSKVEEKRKAISAFRDEMRAYLQAEFTKAFGDWYSEASASPISSISVSIPWVLETRFIEAEEIETARSALKKQQEQAVKDILIELELGATKADLDKLLSAVNPRIGEG